ncbi:MAG: hypothetical protein FWC20_08805 [Oscillospiraceae bacterium]|nr:hypothetical protein [Oscillospiraceae bacterium]MCL2279488.1 hypothetical protein [Oscillospiraceae bacterium]
MKNTDPGAVISITQVRKDYEARVRAEQHTASAAKTPHSGRAISTGARTGLLVELDCDNPQSPQCYFCPASVTTRGSSLRTGESHCGYRKSGVAVL